MFINLSLGFLLNLSSEVGFFINNPYYSCCFLYWIVRTQRIPIWSLLGLFVIFGVTLWFLMESFLSVLGRFDVLCF
jgi:hypothetical protein